jgi:nickel-type superoxide dismutase maturation protease
MQGELKSARPLDYILLLFKRRWRFRVTGASMSPTLESGEWLIVDPGAYQTDRPQVGDVVIARHPFQSDLKIVKRVTAVTTNSHFHLQGDNPSSLESSDSRAFGPLPISHILGKVTHRIL